MMKPTRPDDFYKTPAMLLAGTLLGIAGTFFAFAKDIRQIPVLVVKVTAVEKAIDETREMIVRYHGGQDE